MAFSQLWRPELHFLQRLWGKILPCLFHCLVSLACGYITSASALFFTWPPPVCLCLLLFCFSEGHIIRLSVPSDNPEWSPLEILNVHHNCRLFSQTGSLSEVQRVNTWTYLFGAHCSTPTHYIRCVGARKISDCLNRCWLQFILWRSLTVLQRLDIGLQMKLIKELTQEKMRLIIHYDYFYLAYWSKAILTDR